VNVKGPGLLQVIRLTSGESATAVPNGGSKFLSNAMLFMWQKS
jgi:hypothetical protein